ncbi:MAG: hypothetical protein CSB33_05540 [Desulfobacterales bacterium]|nr:MAG: hypothetical protein CSB33_05540 [Desulfobacterales bacterium]
MREIFQSAFSAGYELMAAWSDLLDEINLYPVADADTGTNLRLSLAPLRTLPDDTAAESLLRGAVCRRPASGPGSPTWHHAFDF